MGLKAREVVLGALAERALTNLEHSNDPKSRSIIRRIEALRILLLSDCLRGEVVRKGSIPRPLAELHQVENLYVEDLPGFWRLLYSIVGNARERFVVIVEIVDHGTYDRWFPGRGR